LPRNRWPSRSGSRRSQSAGHSGQVSPIESSASAIAPAAACGETPNGRLSSAILNASSRACGSPRSFFQPCSSQARIAPASISTEIAHPSSIRIAGFGFFVTSISNSLRGRIPDGGIGSLIGKDSDSLEPTIYCRRVVILEFATCPFDRGTSPIVWPGVADRTVSSGNRFRCHANKLEPRPKPF
jgi:hypothetical protein